VISRFAVCLPARERLRRDGGGRMAGEWRANGQVQARHFSGSAANVIPFCDDRWKEETASDRYEASIPFLRRAACTVPLSGNAGCLHFFLQPPRPIIHLAQRKSPYDSKKMHKKH